MVSPSVVLLPIAGIDVRALVIGLALTTAAAYAGGATVAFLRLGHRRMQVLLSFTGGILLGVAFLHLLPHATRACGGRVDDAAPWVLAGFFLMFLLERAFHGHAHHAADPEHGPAGGCDHGTHAPHPPGPHHDPDPVEAGPIGRGGASWYGAFAGLAVHSLADGAALAAAMDLSAGRGGLLTGLAPLLAILLHKPVDAGLIAALMLKAGASPGLRRTVNLAHALLVPLGAAIFLACLRGVGGGREEFLGAALGLAAGAFVCIAAADLLPEVEFHSHDRLLLSASLALGITLAAGITVAERAFRVPTGAVQADLPAAPSAVP
jgi:zinc and cadmium transporter